MDVTLSYGASRCNISGGNAALGILPNNRPAASGAASGALSWVDQSTGELIDFNDSRALRYIRQSAARRLLPGQRVSWCLRRTGDSERPALLKDKKTGKAHYGGLISCGRVWSCPVCAAKVSTRRRDELKTAFDIHRIRGGALFLVTWTFRHSLHDDLAGMIEKLKKAADAVKAHRQYKEMKAAHGVIGTIRGLEITHGVNGWHPHLHEVWMLKDSVNESATRQALQTRLFEIWRKQCIKKGLGEPNEDHGIDVRNGDYADRYAAKWGLEAEVSKGMIKEGYGKSRTPFMLLDSYIDGDKQAGALFIEYVKAFQGQRKRQLVWSNGLKKMFNIAEKDDEEIAAEKPESADRLGFFDLDQWRLILKFRGARVDTRAQILRVAEASGWEGVLQFLKSLEFAKKSSVRFSESIE